MDFNRDVLHFILQPFTLRYEYDHLSVGHLFGPHHPLSTSPTISASDDVEIVSRHDQGPTESSVGYSDVAIGRRVGYSATQERDSGPSSPAGQRHCVA